LEGFWKAFGRPLEGSTFEGWKAAGRLVLWKAFGNPLEGSTFEGLVFFLSCLKYFL
jgi:hypothetical protein